MTQGHLDWVPLCVLCSTAGSTSAMICRTILYQTSPMTDVSRTMIPWRKGKVKGCTEIEPKWLWLITLGVDASPAGWGLSTPVRIPLRRDGLQFLDSRCSVVSGSPVVVSVVVTVLVKVSRGVSAFVVARSLRSAGTARR